MDRLVKAYRNHVKPHIHQSSFITLHYTYFIATCLVSSLIFWGSSTPSLSVRYIDSIFLTVSAMTEAGLNTVNLSTLNTWQQIILFLLIMMGSAIFVSSAVIHIRKQAFERKLQELAERREQRLSRPLAFTWSKSKRRNSSLSRTKIEAPADLVRGQPIPAQPRQTEAEGDPNSTDEGNEKLGQPKDDSDVDEPGVPSSRMRIQFADDVRPPTSGDHGTGARSQRDDLSRVFSNTGVGAHSVYYHPRRAVPQTTALPAPNLTHQPTISPLNKYVDTINGYIGRNSQFHNLTDEERRKLGGIEYDALCLLSWLVPTYYVLFQLFGAIGCGAWLQINRPSLAYENGLNPFWTGAFFAVSAFNNSGMALLDANASALQTSYYMLLTMSLLILAGNTCFPVFLRLILWTMKKIIPKSTESEYWTEKRQVLTFILEHPRRVYTNLFPSGPTWWLVATLVTLNGIDWIAFEILNIGNPTTASIPARFRWMDGLFQAFAVRCGGFYVVAIAGLYPGTLILYVLMMYVSAFPITMTIRNTNVYEERSLAIFAEDPPEPEESRQIHSNPLSPLGLARTMTSRTQKQPVRTGWSRQDFIRQQLRSQLGHDLWLLSLAVLFIAIIETHEINTDPVNFSIFNIIFEVVSAYGTVGISVGVPWNAYSFCGAWQTLSKLILCVVMLRGRHRGLPVAIDRAILLPDESLAWAEEEDAARREWKARRPSLSRATTSGMDFPEGYSTSRKPTIADEEAGGIEKPRSNLDDANGVDVGGNRKQD